MNANIVFATYHSQTFRSLASLKHPEDNKKFNFSLFRKKTIKIAFDALYGLPKEKLTEFNVHKFVDLYYTTLT